MASCIPGFLGRNPFSLSPKTLGPLGVNDAASPDSPQDLLGDTPGSLGCNDYADPLYEKGIYFTLSTDEDLLLWDYDPFQRLEDPALNPQFVHYAHAGFRAAVAAGLRPKAGEVYRTPQRSKELHDAYKSGRSKSYAAPPWESVHNYGMAMDVYVYNSKGQPIGHGENFVQPKGVDIDKLYERLALYMGWRFTWGGNFKKKDTPHFEFHPSLSQGANGPLLKQTRKWAMDAAGAGMSSGRASSQLSEEEWMPHFWWAAGAGGSSPSAEFLKDNPVPVWR